MPERKKVTFSLPAPKLTHLVLCGLSLWTVPLAMLYPVAAAKLAVSLFVSATMIGIIWICCERYVAGEWP